MNAALQTARSAEPSVTVTLPARVVLDMSKPFGPLTGLPREQICGFDETLELFVLAFVLYGPVRDWVLLLLRQR